MFWGFLAFIIMFLDFPMTTVSLMSDHSDLSVANVPLVVDSVDKSHYCVSQNLQFLYLIHFFFQW